MLLKLKMYSLFASQKVFNVVAREGGLKSVARSAWVRIVTIPGVTFEASSFLELGPVATSLDMRLDDFVEAVLRVAARTDSPRGIEFLDCIMIHPAIVGKVISTKLKRLKAPVYIPGLRLRRRKGPKSNAEPL